MIARFMRNIQVNSWVLVGLIPILILLEVFFPYQGWMILLIGLIGILTIGYFWVHSLRKNLSMHRQMRYGWAQVGDELEERFIIHNAGPIPALWIEVQDFSNIPSYHVSRATGVPGNSDNSWTTHQTCNRRGLYILGPTHLRTGDPFSVFTLNLPFDNTATLLVTPPILQLPSIQVAAGGRAGEGRSSRKVIEESVLTSGVREYNPEDALRRIHWPTTAHRDQTFVKTFDHLPSGDWWIVVDLDETVQFGEGNESTEETAVILAASLADRGLKAGIPVGLITNSTQLTWLPPRLGDDQRWLMMETLAKATPGSGTLASILNSDMPGIRQQSSLVVITPNSSDQWLPGLIRLSWHGTVPTVLLLDPPAFGGLNSSRTLQTILVDQGVQVYPITPDILIQPKQPIQPKNAWEWRTSPTGRAVAIHQPRDLAWRDLS